MLSHLMASDWNSTVYGKITLTTTLCKHLCSKNYIDKWIIKFKRLKIEIKAKEAVETIAAY